MNIKEFFRCDNGTVVIFKGSYVFQRLYNEGYMK